MVTVFGTSTFRTLDFMHNVIENSHHFFLCMNPKNGPICVRKPVDLNLKVILRNKIFVNNNYIKGLGKNEWTLVDLITFFIV